MNNSLKTDKKLCMFICVYFLFNNINSVLQKVFGLSGSILNAEKLLIQFILLCLLIYSINHMQIKTAFKYIAGVLFVFLLLLYSWFVGISFSISYIYGFTLITVCVPLGISAYIIEDKQILYNYLLKFSWIILPILILNVIEGTDSYDMHFSYGILLLILVHLTEWFNTKKKLYLGISIIEIVLMLIYGSRGAVVCVISLILLRILCSNETSIRHKLIKTFITLIIVGGVYWIFIENIDKVVYFIQSKGISSRTISLILSGNFLSHDSGRNLLWETTSGLISEKPLQGWGLNGASHLLGNKGKYPHQLFLDLILTFGYPIGILFSCFIVFTCRKIITTKNICEQQLIHIFFSLSFVRLMFSSTVFTDYTFAIMMGLMLSEGKYLEITQRNIDNLEA